MNGLFLQGGGAKGAFQAGVIYGLYERGYEFNIISGTSIGAINSYFIYKNEIEKMKKFWIENDFAGEIPFDVVIDNQGMIDYLSTLEGINEVIDNVYVNYTHVENNQLKEVVVDLVKSPHNAQLKAIKYSSLLPYRMKDYDSIEDVRNSFDSSIMCENFIEDLQSGIYESYNIDGGVVNNNFLFPFIEHKVDNLCLIVFKKNYEIPDYIINNYSMNDIVVIEPKTDFKANDTLRFEHEFLNSIFQEGYAISKQVIF